MRFITRLGFLVLIGLSMISGASRVAAQAPATTVTRLFTAADGQSHAEDTVIAWRPAKLRAELKESESVKVTGAQFLRWPRGLALTLFDTLPVAKRAFTHAMLFGLR